MCRQCVASFSQELQIREATYKQDAYSDYGGGGGGRDLHSVQSEFATEVCHLFRDLGVVHVR